MGTPALAPKNSRLPWILAGIIGLLVVCMGVVAVVAFLFRDQLLELVGLGKAQSAMIAPADTAIYMALNLDLTQAADAKRILDIYQKVAPVQSNQTDYKKQFADSTGLDFDQDVASWAGPEVGLIFTDIRGLAPDAFSTGSALPKFAVTIGTRDRNKSDAALKKLYEKLKSKDTSLSQDTYKGTALTVLQQPESSNPAYVATVRNFVVLASSLDSMHAVVDANAAGGARVLANNPKFKDVLAKLPSSRFGTLYLPYDVVRQIQSLSPGVTAQTLGGIEAADTLAASLGFTNDGVRVDYALTYDQTKLTDTYKKVLSRAPNANRGLKAVGAGTLMYASGADLKGTWEATLDGMDPATKAQAQKSIVAFEEQIGFNVNDDLLSWLTGEYAIAVVPAKPVAESAPGIGVLALVEVADKNLVDGKLSKIGDALLRSGMVFQQETINGVPMHTMQLGATTDSPTAGYGFIGNFLVLGGPRDALISAVDAPKNALADDPLFKRVQARLPSPNLGYYYLNVTAIQSLLEQMSGQFGPAFGGSGSPYETTVKPLLQPIKAVGAAGQNSSTQLTSGTIFVLVDQP